MPADEERGEGGRKASIRPTTESSIDSGRPVIREEMEFDKMHPSFPDKHGYLKSSLKDLDEVNKKVGSLKEEDSEQVVIQEQEQEPDETVSKDELDSYDEFKKRRIRNKAIKKVEENLRSEGVSEDFIRDNRDEIESRVDEYLFG